MDLFDEINRHTNLYLDRSEDTIEDGRLKLTLWLDECGDLNATSRKYRVIFYNYVAYSVRNESFTVWDEYEEFNGNMFREYSKSRFLDYLSSSTNLWIVEQTQGAMPKHFGAICLDYLIDVASCVEPKIELISN